MKTLARRNAGSRHLIRATLIVGSALACLCADSQDTKTADPIADQFYSPELVQMSHEALGLSAEQEAALQETMQKVQAKAADFQERMQAERAKLVRMVREERLDEEAVVRQASRVMDLERDVKMARLVLMIKIKNILTPEQQAKLGQFKDKMPAIQAKVRQAEELVDKWKEQGRDIAPFDQARDEFKRLIHEGNLKEAEKLLDKTLERLKATAK